MYKSEATPEKTCHEIFNTICSRQIEALMLHDQMADYFNFLGYSGYKCMHEYQYFSESVAFRDTKKYFMSHHNMLIKDSAISDPKIIPTDWYSRERKEANESVKLKAVRDGMTLYHTWEKDTLKMYEECAKMLLENGSILDYEYVLCLIKDVSEELQEIEKIILNLISTDYDTVHILNSQRMLHEKYKKKMKSI